MKQFIIGIDIGGTTIKGGIINLTGNVVIKDEVLTESHLGTEHIISNIVNLVYLLLNNSKIDMNDCLGIGIGVPGIVDSDRNIVVFSNTLKWKNFDLSRALSKSFFIPIKIENDANLATFGEYKFGCGKGTKHAILLTLGTGVGSGFILNGKIYSGNQGCGAEFGHSILVKNGDKCACGRNGCVEAYASATALINYAKLVLKQNPNSLIFQSINNIDEVTPKIIFQHKGKDNVADFIINRYVNYLADAILQLCDTLRPEIIMIGGGVSNAGDDLILPLQELVNNNIFAKELTTKVEIKQASLGNDAGFIGACALFLD